MMMMNDSKIISINLEDSVAEMIMFLADEMKDVPDNAIRILSRHISQGPHGYYMDIKHDDLSDVLASLLASVFAGGKLYIHAMELEQGNQMLIDEIDKILKKLSSLEAAFETMMNINQNKSHIS